MASLARVVVPGYPHHVTHRGVRCLNVFFCESDRTLYLSLLARNASRHGLEVLSYCLMTNHVHLVVIPEKEASLARGIGDTHKEYSREINFRQGARGYLFQGRFSSCAMDENHLLAAIRYVERNPVRARMADHAWDYPWSSAAFRVGLRARDPLLSNRDVMGIRLGWRKHLAEESDESASLRCGTRTGRPIGSDGFLRHAEQVTGRCLKMGKPGRRPAMELSDVSPD